MYFLTATPINNGISDLYRMISLFTNENEAHFASIGIHNLKGHFMRMKRDLNKLIFDDEDADDEPEGDLTTKEEADQRLKNDRIVKSLIVQRSRNFVRESMKNADRDIVFPNPPKPKGAYYDLEAVYGDLIDEFNKAFAKKDPLFKLSIYYPYEYYRDQKALEEMEDFDFKVGRLKQIARLIRIGILKRFESSVHAFDTSCCKLMIKLIAWLDSHQIDDEAKKRLAEWKKEHEDLVRHAKSVISAGFEDGLAEDQDDEEDDDREHDSPCGDPRRSRRHQIARRVATRGHLGVQRVAALPPGARERLAQRRVQGSHERADLLIVPPGETIVKQPCAVVPPAAEQRFVARRPAAAREPLAQHARPTLATQDIAVVCWA